MNNNKNLLVLFLFIGIFSSITYWIGFKSNKQTKKSYSNNWENVDFILDHLISNYVDSLERKTLLQKSILNILKDLDPHSTFIPSSKRQVVNEPLVGHFGGIGIRFMILRDTLTVVDVIDKGPSSKKGLIKRDKIIEIDEENIASTGIKNKDVLEKLKGKVGSKVSLKLYRPDKSYKNVKITRGLIPIKSIAASTKLDKNIGYIKVNSFSNTTDNEFKAALVDLLDSGMNALILDLRFNGGGYLHQAINIADEFLSEKKLIVYTEGAHVEKRSYYATKKGGFEKGKLVILVNSGTASASEIVSGAIQDHKRGIIIGRRTFGKGLVQQPVLLPDSSELRITTSRYFTPSGKCIQKPYGDTIDYENDIFERLESGELTLKDSINDEIKNKGGIWPDIFSPIDTLNFNEIVSTITFSKQWRNFCFDFYSSNPKKPHNNIFTFYKKFKIQDGLLEDYFKNNKLKKELLTKQVIIDLRWSMMLEICNYYYDDQSRYILSALKDSDVKKAIEQINISMAPLQ